MRGEQYTIGEVHIVGDFPGSEDQGPARRLPW